MKKCFAIAIFSLVILISCDTKAAQREQAQAETIQLMEKVTDWQLANFTFRSEGNLHDYGVGAWTNGVLYIGISEFAEIATKEKKTEYNNWLYKLGSDAHWLIPANFKNYEKYSFYHADELCVAQYYIEMYKAHKEDSIIASTVERLDWIMSNRPDSLMSHKGKKSWTWCDALFMAPPVYAQIAAIKKDNSYVEYMNQEFKKTYDHLYDAEEKLFFRDDSYFGKEEANGTKIFWGRGNGWVVAGLANMLKILPETDPQYKFYVDLYKVMIERLVELRNEDGFWHASLLDPASYPSPETSATAMITYAIAYGVNNGYLAKEKYAPIALSSWKALTSVVNQDGKLGYVQPIGADPKKVTEDMTAVYGVGAFLLAGTEIHSFIE